MTIKAKYAGHCAKCGGAIKVGDLIDWERGRGASHAVCPKAEAEPAGTIRLSGGSGYGCRGWRVGEVVRNQQYRIDKGEPEYVVILSARSRYIREDGMSFGVGDEEGYVYGATCRTATPEEAAPLIAEREANAAKVAAVKELQAIADEIKQRGERPEGKDNRPEGERVSDTQTVYGGGDWFVIGEAHIWYVRNNGADGDDWACNNVRTGGAGAIGWRVPFDTGLADRIIKAAAVAGRKAR